jgi:hypothetical protein
MRRPDHLPAGFAPESPLNSIERIANPDSGVNARRSIHEMSST